VGTHPATCLVLKPACGVPDLQGTNSDSRAHFGRGNEPAGGATISPPCTAILNFYLGSYLSRSLAAQGPQKNFTEKRLAHSGPLRGIAKGLVMPTTLLQDVMWQEEAHMAESLVGRVGDP
jgi:hypothetical protein